MSDILSVASQVYSSRWERGSLLKHSPFYSPFLSLCVATHFFLDHHARVLELNENGTIYARKIGSLLLQSVRVCVANSIYFVFFGDDPLQIWFGRTPCHLLNFFFLHNTTESSECWPFNKEGEEHKRIQERTPSHLFNKGNSVC